MTRDELIAELSKYPPDAEVRLKTTGDSCDIESVEGAGSLIKIFGEGWDDDYEDDDEDDEEYCNDCGELSEDCDCDEPDDAEPDDE